MTASPSRPMPGRPQARCLLVLFALGWLNLVAQPCLADMPMMPAGMENCDHGGTPVHPAPCVWMQMDDCVISNDLNSDTPRAGEVPRSGALLSVLPPVPILQQPAAIAAGPHIAGDPTGPPLNIRYCNLRN